MRKYKLYRHMQVERELLITENDMVIYSKDKEHNYAWFRWPYVDVFMVGDLALDQGFKFVKILSKEELFAELL